MKKSEMGKNIYLDRYSLGISQADVALVLKTSQQAVARWETGRSFPRHAVLDRLKEFFKTELEKIGQESLVNTTVIDFPAPTKKPELKIELRDYFAARAMQGLMHNYHPCDFLENKNYLEDIAMASYFMANAMMKAKQND
jgi:transcriptional regulator with XRE-family HTH domain